MPKIYKSGSWAEDGRVMPGKRIKEKRIDQLLSDGTVIIRNEDQLFSQKEYKEVLISLFPDSYEANNHIFLKKKTENGKSIGFYTRNIYHLGGDWSSEKKRIEIGRDFLNFYENNKKQEIETILLGTYHYYPDEKNGVILFVCFSADTYATRNVNNSAAHIHTLDLQNALKNGVYRRLDKSNNEIFVLDKENFVNYINGLRSEKQLQVIKTDKELLDYFGKLYKTIPKTLYGIQCYEQMFAANDQNRKQGAWEGWFMEYYVKKYLSAHPTEAIEWWSSKKKNDLDFDLKFHTEDNFYGDIKSDDARKSVQGNKKSNIDMLVKEKNGRLWYVVFEFLPEKDSEHNNETTIWWNKKLGKEKLLSYASRMKYSITLQNLNVYEINQFAFKYLNDYSVSPCDEKPREAKYKIPNKMKEFLRIYQCS